jgi:hypothetical protein
VTEPTPIEPDALSRFEGEGGHESQIPEWVDVSLALNVAEAEHNER